ncbi:hypothetical protein [Nicoliella lavandulae]|uniref:Lipocalin-like domain-containing protein n=1 Tax=Nicoliella lavandulae TaxID=3082954 RepID=A0ABU8SLP7_9LACO
MQKYLFNTLKYLLVTVLSLSIVGMIGSETHASNLRTTPSSIRGTWYNYNKFVDNDNSKLGKHFTILKINKNNFNWNGNKISNNEGKQLKGYYQFGTVSDFTDGLAAWTKKMKINGSYQKVLVTYQRQGAFMVFTKKPIKHNYSYTLSNDKIQNYQDYIGK